MSEYYTNWGYTVHQILDIQAQTCNEDKEIPGMYITIIAIESCTHTKLHVNKGSNLRR